MNCFDWQNRASDYLDGALIGTMKREADEHLEKCESCGTRYKHYRLILTSIASQPRVSLPVAIRKAPLSAPIAKEGRFRVTNGLKLWSNTPWYVKIPLESAAIVVAISAAISTAPRLRMLYERKMERSLTDYAAGFKSQDLTDDAGLMNTSATAPAPQQSTGTQAASASDTGASMKDSEDDFSGGDGEDTSEDAQEGLKAGKAEIWRFNFKTDSPTDVRGKIVTILSGMKLPSNLPGIQGVEVPGGIQFDLMVPQSIVTTIKVALEKIAPIAPKDTEDTPLSETFTWYKSRSKHPVPAGKTHVVIWVSQI